MNAPLPVGAAWPSGEGWKEECFPAGGSGFAGDDAVEAAVGEGFA